MFHRVAIVSLTFVLLTTVNLNAGGDFPKTAEDYASLYEMHLYQQFQGNSAEFRRRIDVSKQVIRDFKKAGKRADERAVINWFMTARQSNVAPAAPVFADAAPAVVTTPAVEASPFASQQPEPTQSGASVAPEYDWNQSSESEDPTPEAEADSESDYEDLAGPSDAPWSADELDEAYGDAIADESSESLVTSDPADSSVIKKSNQLPTTTEPDADSDAAETDEAMPDLSEVWGDSASDETEAESADSLASADGLQEAAAAAADATGLGDMMGDSSDWTSSIPTAPGGTIAAPALGVAPMAMMGLGVINGIISLICMIKQLVAAFKNSALLGIVSLVFCGIGGLIIGWIKHKEWGLTKTMKVWTACMVFGILIQIGAGIMAGMGG